MGEGLCTQYYEIQKDEENIQKLNSNIYWILFPHQHWEEWNTTVSGFKFSMYVHTHFRRDNIQWACWYFTWSPRSYKGHPKIVLQHSQHWLLFTDRSWDLSCWTCQTLTQMNWYAQKTTSLLFHDLASSWSWEKKASTLFVSIKKLIKMRYKKKKS